MKERKAVTKQLCQRYKKATKKQKTIMLDEFTALTGYNRAYASYLLSINGKTVYINENAVLKADLKKKVKRKRKSYYGAYQTLVKFLENQLSFLRILLTTCLSSLSRSFIASSVHSILNKSA